MNTENIAIEYVGKTNSEYLKQIIRDDVSEEFVDSVETLLEITQYGIEHKCIGHTYAIKYEKQYIGVVLLGEALEWDTDPKEMKEEPFYRLMGFLIDKRYRGKGIGSYVLEKIINECYLEYGKRPIALGVHKDNDKAGKFYTKHGFKKTQVMEGNDFYFLRYPQ